MNDLVLVFFALGPWSRTYDRPPNARILNSRRRDTERMSCGFHMNCFRRVSVAGLRTTRSGFYIETILDLNCLMKHFVSFEWKTDK